MGGDRGLRGRKGKGEGVPRVSRGSRRATKKRENNEKEHYLPRKPGTLEGYQLVRDHEASSTPDITNVTHMVPAAETLVSKIHTDPEPPQPLEEQMDCIEPTLTHAALAMPKHGRLNSIPLSPPK